MREHVLDALAHLCALAALGYAARAAKVAHGWVAVPAVDDLPDAPSLSIIVPARNEARSIERCVRSLLAQTLRDVELIVVDDRSDDGTDAILASLAREFPQLRVILGEPLPAGWVGKPWALTQGTRVARGAWLLFTDADTWHAPHASASTLALARARGADALTLWTGQELGSLAERAILPTVLGLVMLASGTMRQLNDPADRTHALANGQYLLFAREAYDALGGHAAVGGEIVEDVMFAYRIKEDGRFRLLLADGSALVRVRMYTNFREVWDGFTKNMYLGARGDLRTLAGAATFLLLISAIPAALAVEGVARRRPWRALESLLTIGLGIAVEQRGLAAAAIPRRLAWYAPIGYAVCAAILVNSTVRVLSGRGVRWRGRRYTGRVAGEQPVADAIP